MLIGTSGQLPASLDDLLPRSLAASLDRLDLVSRRILSGRLPGERRSKRRGRSVEFDDFRAYTPGDDLRHIDWNIYARLDRLLIKLFREEEDLSLHLLLDSSPSMRVGTPDKLIWSHQLAMALGYIGLVNQNRVAATVVGGGQAAARTRLAPIRGRTSLPRLSQFLLTSLQGSPQRDESAPRSFAAGLATAGIGKIDRGVVLVMSDFLCEEDDPRELEAGIRQLGALAARGADVYCLKVASPGEDDPALEQPRGLLGDLRLLSVESGNSREVTITPNLIARYRARRTRYQAALAALCGTHGLRLLAARTDESVSEVVLQSLRRGGMVG